MAICMDCKRLGEKAKDVFTQAERVHLLAAASAMARQIHHGSGRSTPNDKLINSSVVTKILLSFPEGMRAMLMQSFQEAVNLSITLNRCPHGAAGVVQ